MAISISTSISTSISIPISPLKDSLKGSLGFLGSLAPWVDCVRAADGLLDPELQVPPDAGGSHCHLVSIYIYKYACV